MMQGTLKLISDLMNTLNIPYAFMEWKGDVPEMYFVGEYQETPSMTLEEDGMQETSFKLAGFTRGSWLSLEDAKSAIEKAIPITAILDDQSGVAIFYGSSLVVPTGEMDIKRIEINLQIKEWKVE